MIGLNWNFLEVDLRTSHIQIFFSGYLFKSIISNISFVAWPQRTANKIASFRYKWNTESFVSVLRYFKTIPTSHGKLYLGKVGFRLWFTFIQWHTNGCLSTSYPSIILNAGKADLVAFNVLLLKPLYLKEWRKFIILFAVGCIQPIFHLLQKSVHILVLRL